MSLSMLEKKPVVATKAPWSAEVSAEFEREKKSPNGCVGKRLLSENERVRVWDIRLAPGETRHESHAKGHFKVHDLENTGPNELHFTTVEFLDSANEPLPVPDSVRMK